IPTQPNPETVPRSVVLSDVAVTEKTFKVKVAGDVVNVRAGAGESFPIIGKVVKDQELAVLDELNGWCRIEPPQDSYGWIYKRFVTKDAGACSKSSTAVSDLKTTVQEGKIVVPVVATVGGEKTATTGVSAVKVSEQPASQEITVRGVVKRFGNIFFKRDKFKIVTPEKKVFLLEYSKSSLEGFLFQTVSVTGTLRVVSKPGIQTIEVSKIEVVD
ncbi:MAG: SH3 domain-containing protein, partial [Candidatus Omnitrophica bacterium]|nr:SH3 domain-containing protein [Candidatus Omnitrophota bacterium]